MEKIIKIISAIPVFRGLSEDSLNQVRKIAKDRFYDKGRIVFSEGDEGDGFYVVADGSVKIYKVSAEGKEHILHIYGPGSPFGEVPVFSGQKFPANAEALIKSHLLFFSRQTFVDLISENPSLAMNMLAVLSMRLREFTIQIENLSLKEVPGRLASHLIYLSDEQKTEDKVLLPVSKGQLASLLGTIPETLSRILNKMNSQGLLEVDGRSIKLLDTHGLRELAEHGKI
ncbi:MAG: Crp/Fnr family transcriptional regulator [Deltaproteobacteria bacterium]|nr:Crp/Fnr family transcriptional regulator [Deltaproteobacteria bacterium]